MMEWFLHLMTIDIWLYVTLGVVTLTLLYWYGTSGWDLFSRIGVADSDTPRIPYIGQLSDVFQISAEEDLQAMKKYPQRMFGSYMGSTAYLHVFDVDVLKAVTIRESAKFTDRRVVTDCEGTIIQSQIFNARGEHWKNIRKLLTPSFTSGKLKTMFADIKHCAERLVRHVESAAAKPIVIKDYTSGYTMDVIASTAFGIQIDVQSTTDHPMVEHAGTFFGIPRKNTFWYKLRGGLGFIVILCCPSWFSRLMRMLFGISFFDQESIEYFSELINKILKDRSQLPEERRDFVSMCIDKVVDMSQVEPQSIHTTKNGLKWTPKGLTKDEVTGNAILFFGAGYETTATSLQFIFYCLAVHPDIQEQLYEAICERGDLSYEEIQKFDYLDWCINESLRMFPPVRRFDRVASDSVVIEGMEIPRGTVINFIPMAVHYNPDYWPEPHLYKPDRFSPDNRTDTQQYAHIPFGSGGRNCIGMRLAMLEVKVAVCEILKRLRLEKTPGTPSLSELKFQKMTLFLSTESPLQISAVPR